MHKCCPECGIEIHKNTICCSRNCSNKHQAKIRKSKIDSETGLTLAQLYAAKTAKIRHENGSYKSESFIEACRKTALITFFSDETKKEEKRIHRTCVYSWS